MIDAVDVLDPANADKLEVMKDELRVYTNNPEVEDALGAAFDAICPTIIGYLNSHKGPWAFRSNCIYPAEKFSFSLQITVSRLP